MLPFTLKGFSGKTYTFDVFPINSEWNSVPAVYAVIDARTSTKYVLIYIGRTDNLKERFSSHEKQPCFDKYNANALCILKENNAASREFIESDLIKKHKPVCNSVIPRRGNMSEAKLWVRNMYTGIGGGAYTGVGGGMYTGVGGGAYTGVGGGMYRGVGGGAYEGVGGGLYRGVGGGAYTGVGGGLYSGVGGGLYTGPGGGLYTGPGGGMYTGPDSNPYMAIHPPWPLFVIELRRMGMHREAQKIENALKSIGWHLQS